VCKVLKRLKPTISVGPDGIPNFVLRKCAPGLDFPLSHCVILLSKIECHLFAGKMLMSYPF